MPALPMRRPLLFLLFLRNFSNCSSPGKTNHDGHWENDQRYLFINCLKKISLAASHQGRPPTCLQTISVLSPHLQLTLHHLQILPSRFFHILVCQEKTRMKGYHNLDTILSFPTVSIGPEPATQSIDRLSAPQD